METTIYTYTTDDDYGTNTYAFGTAEERDKKAFQWMITAMISRNLEHGVLIGLSIPDAYEVFEELCEGFDDLLWWDNHTVTIPNVK